MTFKPIYDPVFFDSNSKLSLCLTISPDKNLELKCSIKKVENTWQIKVHLVCLVSQNHENAPKTFVCKLKPVDLQAMESRVIGAWKEVFLKESGNQLNLPAFIRDIDWDRLDPIDALDQFANQDLLEISAYENGITLKSEYLKIKT